MLSPPLPAALTDHHEAIADLCRAYGVSRLEVFGSATDGHFDPQHSDFDFIVRLAPAAAPALGSLGRRFVGLAESLEAVLGRRVDLITDMPIRNPYFRQAVDASRRLLYERPPAEAPA